MLQLRHLAGVNPACNRIRAGAAQMERSSTWSCVYLKWGDQTSALLILSHKELFREDRFRIKLIKMCINFGCLFFLTPTPAVIHKQAYQ